VVENVYNAVRTDSLHKVDNVSSLKGNNVPYEAKCALNLKVTLKFIVFRKQKPDLE